MGTDYTFSRIGGRLCLDFANTIGSPFAADPNEHLHTYEDLLEWARQLELVTPRAARALHAEAERHSGRAAACLARAKALRLTIYRVFSAIAAGGAPAAADLEALNGELAKTLGRQRLVLDAGAEAPGLHLRWDWSAAGGDLDVMLWPAARSAGELLTDGAELARVRECVSDTCGWLFVDSSKNRSRRWCDMADCGNRAKARRHYHRARKSGEE